MRQGCPGLIVLLVIACSATALAQTTTTNYPAPKGSVSGTAAATLHLTPGGTAVVAPGVSGCSLVPQNCGFNTGYVSYTLADSTSADLVGFHGSMDALPGSVVNNVVYHVHGTASGVDSEGSPVSAEAEFTMRAQCKPVGKATSCTKTYLGGSLTVTK